jgi:hypothetical protein
LKFSFIGNTAERIRFHEAYHADTISAVTAVIRHGDLTHEDPIRLWFEEALDIISQPHSLPYERCFHDRRACTRKEALWRTLVGDMYLAIDSSSTYTSWAEYAEKRRSNFGKPYVECLKFGRPAPDNLAESFEAWKSLPSCLNLPYFFEHSRRIIPEAVQQAARFSLATWPCTEGRRFAITKLGYMCLVPPGSEVGDHAFIFRDARLPYLLRPNTSHEDGAVSGMYKLVGNCYIHGWMDGEMLCCAPGSVRKSWRARSCSIEVS